MNDGSMDASAMRPNLVEAAFPVFLRLVAAYSLLFGVFYWVRLIGYYEGPLWRFDTMPVEWQVAAVTLAALFPVAGIGLWMTASWGPVIWFICAVAEAVMYLGFPEIFGYRPLVVAVHGAVALLYLAFRVALHYLQKSSRA